MLEIWTPVDEDSVKSPTPSRVPVIGRKFQFSNLQEFPKFLETLEAGGDTTCAFDGIDDDDLNAIWRILRAELVRIEAEKILDAAGTKTATRFIK